MNNNIINNVEFINGLNINPIPLEFTQQLTTTKWLAEMQARLTTVINTVNSWYDTILNDLENGGVLYQTLIEHIDGEFTQQLTAFQLNLTTLETTLNALILQHANDIDNLQSEIDLINYVKPSISLNSAPSQTLYTLGESINSIVLTFNVIKGSNNIVKAEIYKNNVLIDSILTVNNGSNIYVDGNVINNDTLYKILLYDDKNNISSNEIQYNFVNNFYYGVSANTLIDEALIKSLTAYKSLKDNLTESFTTTDQKIIFAYPLSYGDLSSIIDSDNYDMIEGFTKSSINLTLNGITIPYLLYVSSNLILDTNVILSFEF